MLRHSKYHYSSWSTLHLLQLRPGHDHLSERVSPSAFSQWANAAEEQATIIPAPTLYRRSQWKGSQTNQLYCQNRREFSWHISYNFHRTWVRISRNRHRAQFTGGRYTRTVRLRPPRNHWMFWYREHDVFAGAVIGRKWCQWLLHCF